MSTLADAPHNMGYANVDRLRAWEATLSGQRLRSWNDLRDSLKCASPEVRASVVSLCLELDLDDGRTAYSSAWKAEQRYKADLIKRNGKQLAEKVGWLSGSVHAALQALEVHRAVAG